MRKIYIHFVLIAFCFWLIGFILPLISDINIVNIIKIVPDSNNALQFNYSFKHILSNNLLSIYSNLIGLLTLGIMSVTNMILNGFFVGSFTIEAIKQNIPLNKILILTLPHCFEYFAIWISGGMGISGVLVIKKQSDINKNDTIAVVCCAYIISTFFIIVAAYIESFIIGKYI